MNGAPEPGAVKCTCSAPSWAVSEVMVGAPGGPVGVEGPGRHGERPVADGVDRFDFDDVARPVGQAGDGGRRGGRSGVIGRPRAPTVARVLDDVVADRGGAGRTGRGPLQGEAAVARRAGHRGRRGGDAGRVGDRHRAVERRARIGKGVRPAGGARVGVRVVGVVGTQAGEPTGGVLPGASALARTIRPELPNRTRRYPPSPRPRRRRRRRRRRRHSRLRCWAHWC